jgi:hypothetical protein
MMKLAFSKLNCQMKLADSDAAYTCLRLKYDEKLRVALQQRIMLVDHRTGYTYMEADVW